MKEGGNNVVNSLFEAKLSATEQNMAKPNCQTDLDTRSHYIYDKYQHRKWYSAKKFVKKKRALGFVPPSPIGETVAVEAEEDFFALRANQNTDDFFDSTEARGNNQEPEEIHFDPNQAMRPSFELMSTLTRMESKRQVLNVIKVIDIDRDNPNPSPKRISKAKGSKTKRLSQSARGFGDKNSFDGPDTDANSKAQSAPQRDSNEFEVNFSFDQPNLMSALTRMESKRLVLNDLKTMDMDWDNPKPKRISQNLQSNSGRAKATTPRRTGSQDEDGASKTRSGSRRRPPARTKSVDSSSSHSRPLRRRPPEKSSSNNSKEEASGRSKPPREPRRGVDRSKSSSNESRSPPREPRRGVDRSKSSSNESTPSSRGTTTTTTTSSSGGNNNNRSRSRSAKRRARRVTSSDSLLHNSIASGVSFKSQGSEDDQSNRSRARRPRIPRDDESSRASRRRRSPKRSDSDPSTYDDSCSSAVSNNNGRLLRRDDESAANNSSSSNSRRRRSPKRVYSEPGGGDDASTTRKNNKTGGSRGGEAPISVRRVTKDRSPRRGDSRGDRSGSKSRSPGSRGGRTVDHITSTLGELLMAED